MITKEERQQIINESRVWILKLADEDGDVFFDEVYDSEETAISDAQDYFDDPKQARLITVESKEPIIHKNGRVSFESKYREIYRRTVAQ